MSSSIITVRSVASDDELRQCQAIRHRVFVVEQGIPAHLDADGLDDTALHSIALEGDRAVATGRLVVSASYGVLARIAVLPSHRRQGLGQRIVQHLESLARKRQLFELSLHPHQHLEDFYRRLGYQTAPGTSVVGAHQLITMVKPLDRD